MVFLVVVGGDRPVDSFCLATFVEFVSSAGEVEDESVVYPVCVSLFT